MLGDGEKRNELSGRTEGIVSGDEEGNILKELIGKHVEVHSSGKDESKYMVGCNINTINSSPSRSSSSISDSTQISITFDPRLSNMTQLLADMPCNHFLIGVLALKHGNKT